MHNNNLFNASKKEYYDESSALKFFKNPINPELGKHKSKISQERREYIEHLHGMMNEFKINVNNRWIFLEFKDWIGYCISNLLLYCDNIIDYKAQYNRDIVSVLEKFRDLFVNKSKYKGFKIKFLTDGQIEYLKDLIAILEKEMGSNELEGYYYLAFRKLFYIKRLLLCHKDIRFLEKKRRDSISKSRGKLRDIIKSNKWQGFLTVTFNEQKIDRYDTELQLTELKKWLDGLKKIGYPELKYLILPDLHMKKVKGRAVVNKKGNYASHFHCLLKNINNIDKLLLKLKDENNINFIDKNNRQVYFFPELNDMFGFSYFTFCDQNIDGLCNYFINHINVHNDFYRRVEKRYYTSEYLDKCKKDNFYVTEENKKNMLRKIYKNKLNKITKKVINFKERTFNQVVECFEIKKVKKDEIIVEKQYQNYSYKFSINYNLFLYRLETVFNKYYKGCSKGS